MFLHVHRESISTLIPCKRYCRKDKTMSVQVLSSDYINKINPQQLDALVKQGVISKRGDKYVVPVGSSIDASCLVKDVDGKVKTFQLDSKGTVVERTTPEHKGEVVGTPQTTYNVSVNALVGQMGLNEEMKTEFNKFLADKNIQVSEGGEISFNDVKSLNDALKEFATAHKENFVDANAQKYIDFTEDSAPEAIDHLKKGDNPAISESPTTEGGRRYAVQNMDALKAGLSEQVGDTSFEDGNVKKSALEVGVTTTTTRKEGILEVPDGLHGDKSARKTLEKNARAAYADFVAKADPQTRDAIDLYIAERKYHKQIDKKMQELSTYTYERADDGKSATAKRDGADIVQYYINNYADKADKAKLNRTIDVISNSTEDADKNAILRELKDANILTTVSSYEDLPAGLKRKGALLAVAKACGYSPDTLLRLMATKEVMGNRTPDQTLKDDQYFIKEQAKDFVKNKQAEQDVKNTTVFFSKEGRKNAPEDGNLHTDIGDNGRRLVKTCPEMLCDELSSEQFNPNEDGAFKVTIGGKERYFKFSSDKWQTFMGICCDPTNVSDDAMKILFGGDAKKKGAFLKDLNLTLQEGRSVMQMQLPTYKGESDTMAFEDILALNKPDKKTSNKELNALRHMVESAGYSVDSNSTAGKRLLHVLKNAGFGTGMGLLTGGLGSLLSGAVTIAGQAVPVTGSVTLPYRDNVVTTDTTNTVLPGGQIITETTIHDTTVSGTTTDEVTLEGHVDGRRGNNHWDNARNAGILGGIAGGVHGLATMGGVQERGRNVDDIFDLTRLTQDEDTVEKPINIEIPQFVEVQTRKGQITVGTEIPKLKAVAYRGPEAYNGLYKYEDGTPVSPRDFARAYQAKVNGKMTDFNFFVFQELTVKGKKIVPVDDYEEQYKKIKPGRPGNVRGVRYNGTGTRTVHAQGTIK